MYAIKKYNLWGWEIPEGMHKVTEKIYMATIWNKFTEGVMGKRCYPNFGNERSLISKQCINIIVNEVFSHRAIVNSDTALPIYWNWTIKEMIVTSWKWSFSLLEQEFTDSKGFQMGGAAVQNPDHPTGTSGNGLCTWPVQKFNNTSRVSDDRSVPLGNHSPSFSFPLTSFSPSSCMTLDLPKNLFKRSY